MGRDDLVPMFADDATIAKLALGKRSYEQRQQQATCVYIMQIVGAGRHLTKVGISKRPKSRVTQLAKLMPFSVRLEGTWHVGEVRAREIETAAHLAMKSLRIKGEWFRCRSKLATSVCNALIAGDVGSEFIAGIVRAEFLTVESEIMLINGSYDPREKKARTRAHVDSMHAEIDAIIASLRARWPAATNEYEPELG